jgi:4-hydroxy-2-oxoheptanedioate aldolase
MAMEWTNKLRRTLDKGEVALGTAVFSNNPTIVEVAGYSGLDFIRIDNEYSWRRDESMEHMIRAAYVAEITPILRVDKGDHYLINKALASGAGGVLVPDVTAKEEVQELIRAAKYPPEGARGYTSFVVSGQWGAMDVEDWLNWNQNEILVGIMVENERIIGQLDSVLSMEGVDFVLFGPADYSMSIGLGGPQKNHPKVQDAIKKTVEVAAKYGKPVAIGVGQPWEEEARKYIDLGCRMLEIGNDVSVLRSVWKAMSSTIRKT